MIRHVAVSRTIALSASARTLASLSAALGGDDGVKAVAWEDAQAEAVAFVNRFASTRAKSTLVGASADTIAIAAQDTYDRAREAAVARVDGDEATAEAEANAVIEAIERVLTAELYDRLFSPTDAADAGDDEALSSRIAALNLSDDLTLERLGLDVAAAEADDTAPTSSIRDDLDELVAACASELHKLSDHLRRSPAAKLAVLVQAHKIIVDRLSAMPPIPMKDERSPADGADHAGKEIELQDDARSLGGRSANRSAVHSPELAAVDAALAVTPRPSSRPSSLQSSDSAVPALNLPSPSQPSSPAGSYFPPASRPAPASSADLILPLLIAAVVRANPARLVSTLRFIERFRAESLLSGEAAYCLTNASASVSFLSAVDLPSLSTLAPSPLTPTAAPIPAPRQQLRGAATNLAVAGASGLIEIAGAIDTGFRIFGGLLSKQPRTLDEVKAVLAGQTAAVKQHGLVRRASAPLLNVAAGDAANARARSQSDAAALRLRDAELDEKAELAAAEVRETASVARPSLGDRLASLARFSDRPSRPVRCSALTCADRADEHASQHLALVDAGRCAADRALPDRRRCRSHAARCWSAARGLSPSGRGAATCTLDNVQQDTRRSAQDFEHAQRDERENDADRHADRPLGQRVVLAVAQLAPVRAQDLLHSLDARESPADARADAWQPVDRLGVPGRRQRARF